MSRPVTGTIPGAGGRFYDQHGMPCQCDVCGPATGEAAAAAGRTALATATARQDAAASRTERAPHVNTTSTPLTRREAAWASEDATIAAATSRHVSSLLTAEMAKSTPDMTFVTAARRVVADADLQVEERAAGVWSWGEAFVHSAPWRQRTNNVTRGNCVLRGYLEERAVTSGYNGPLPGPPAASLAPLAARCSQAALTGWSGQYPRMAGQITAEVVQEGALKPTTEPDVDVRPYKADMIAATVPLPRQAAEDEPVLVTMINTMMRTALGRKVDERVVQAMDSDPDIVTLPAGTDPRQSVAAAIWSLRSLGYTNRITVVADADGCSRLVEADLPSGTELVASAAVAAGVTYAAAMDAALLFAGRDAELSTTNAHLSEFVRNRLRIRAEMLAWAGVMAPNAIIRVGGTEGSEGRRVGKGK